MSNVQTKAPERNELKDVSISTAKQWCKDARKLLGLGISGDAKKLKEANKKAHAKLEKLSELYHGDLPKDLQKLQGEYVGLAQKLKQLESEHQQLELTYKAADQNINSKWLPTRMKQKEQWEPAKQRAREGQQAVEQKMREEAERLRLMAQVLEESVEQRVAELKKHDEELRKNQEIYEAIQLAKKGWTTLLESLDKTASHFESKCDGATAKEIRGQYTRFAEFDWLTVNDVSAAQDVVRQVDLANQQWRVRKEAYARGQKIYSESKKAVRAAVRKAEEMLPPGALGDTLTQFYAGQDAALNRQWDVAGEKINPEFEKKVLDLVSKTEDTYRIWQQIKSDQYQDIKSKLDQLGDAAFNILGLSPLAEAVSLGDSSKDYEKAIKKFADAEKKANEVLAVAAAAAKHATTLINLAQSTYEAIESLKGPARLLGESHRGEIEAALAQYMDGYHVATTKELETLFNQCKKQLEDLASEVKGLSDSDTVDKLLEDLANSTDFSDNITILNGWVDKVQNAIYEYQGLGFDPVEDGKLLSKWQPTVETCQTFIASLNRVQEKGQTENQDKIAEQFKSNCAAMSKLLDEIETQITTAQQQVPAAQQELVAKLKELKRILSDNRWMTLREATWHAAAMVEYAKLESVVGSGNVALLKETTARAEELRAIGDNSLTYYVNREAGIEVDGRYDGLKAAFKDLLSTINKKELKLLYGPQRDKLFTAITDAQSKLRGAGPGTMDKTYASWQQQLTELTRQRDALLNEYRQFKAEREKSLNAVNEVKSRIGGELAEAINKTTSKKVNAGNLPIMQKALTIEAQLGTANLSGLPDLNRRISNLEQELELLIADTDGYAELVQADQNARQEDAQRVDALLQLQAQYDRELEKFNEVFKRIKAMKGVDREEKKRIKELADDARSSAKSKDWAAARRKMSLAVRLAEQLERDPLASQTTQRGVSHLKELNPRWTRGIDTLIDSVQRLSGAIDKSCDDSEKPVVTVFNSKIASRFAKALKKDDFQQELLVLGTEAPKGSDEAKDRNYRKKIREQALVKVRRYRDVVSKDPAFTALMTESNPWSRSGGAVQGLDLMRALNDLDLNLQRSI